MRCWSEWQSSRPFLNNFIKIFASTKIVTCGKSMISRRYINIITVYLFNLWRYFPSSGFIFHPVLIFSRLVIFAFDFKFSFVFVSHLGCPFIFWTWMSLKSISNTYFASSLIWSFWFWIPVLTSRQFPIVASFKGISNFHSPLSRCFFRFLPSDNEAVNRQYFSYFYIYLSNLIYCAIYDVKAVHHHR